MPGDISSSSGEDEETSPTAAPTSRKVAKENAYKCPDDFVSFTHKPCSSTLSDSLKNKNCELWLIKAPSSFNPERFNGVAVPLSGLQTLCVPAAAPGAEAASGRQGLYSVLGSTRNPGELHLLTANGATASDQVVCGPAFSGVLNVCEIYGGGGADDALLRPKAIPAAPAPAIPLGLKQRFLPFGCRTPTLTCVAESELDAGAAGPSSATLRPRVVKHFTAEEEGMTEEERRKERKRKKREKRIKTESQEPGASEGEVQVKVEPVGTPFQGGAEQTESLEAALLLLQDGGSEERRKKKKRKKEKEPEATPASEVVLGEAEGGCRVKLEVEVKHEPMDFSYEDLEGSAKKKKKKRKSRTEDA